MFKLIVGPMHNGAASGNRTGHGLDYVGELLQVSIQVCHRSADLSDIILSPLVRPLRSRSSPAAQTVFIIPLSGQESQGFFWYAHQLVVVLHIGQADAAVDRVQGGIHDGLPDVVADEGGAGQKLLAPR